MQEAAAMVPMEQAAAAVVRGSIYERERERGRLSELFCWSVRIRGAPRRCVAVAICVQRCSILSQHLCFYVSGFVCVLCVVHFWY